MNPFGIEGDLPTAIQQRLREPKDAADFIQRLHDDFLFFIAAVWEDRGLHRKAPLSWYELDMAEFAATGPKRRGVLAYRGAGKTHIVTSAISAFRLLRDPDRKVFIISKSKPSATETVGFVREWLDAVWFLRHLAPRPGTLDNKTSFNVAGAQEARQPSVKAEGIEGQLEGNRGHTIIPDDIETKDNSKTLEGRENLENLVKELKNILYPDRAFEDGGPIDPCEIIDVGTPKHEETIYAKRIKQGYTYQSYPIAFPAADEKIISPAPVIQQRIDAGLNKPGSPTCPHRFGDSEIDERQAEGRSEYARESMLIADLASTNRYPLRLADLIILEVPTDKAPVSVKWGTQNHSGSTAIDDIPFLGFGAGRLHRPIYVDPTWAPYTSTVMTIDPSGEGDDKTGCGIVSHLAGFLWVHRLLGLAGGFSDDALTSIASLARQFNCRSIYIEDNWGGGMFATLLQPVLQRHFIKAGESPDFPDGWACSIVDDKKVTHAHGQKELRIIDTLEPVISTHRLILDPSVVIQVPDEPLEHTFQHQLSRLTKQPKCLKEDGKLDALTLAVKAWQHILHVDPTKAAGRAKNNVIDSMQAKLRSLTGQRPRALPRWSTP